MTEASVGFWGGNSWGDLKGFPLEVCIEDYVYSCSCIVDVCVSFSCIYQQCLDTFWDMYFLLLSMFGCDEVPRSRMNS